MARDIKRIQIVSNDAVPSAVRVLGMDGEPIHGVMALDLRVRPNDVATATLQVWVGGVNVVAEAEYVMHDPHNGQLKAVESIKFVNEAPIWCRENKLVVIGWLGIRRAYLNVSREEAVARYMRDQDHNEPPPDDKIDEFTFTDEFGVYDAWTKG